MNLNLNAFPENFQEGHKRQINEESYEMTQRTLTNMEDDGFPSFSNRGIFEVGGPQQMIKTVSSPGPLYTQSFVPSSLKKTNSEVPRLTNIDSARVSYSTGGGYSTIRGVELNNVYPNHVNLMMDPLENNNVNNVRNMNITPVRNSNAFKALPVAGNYNTLNLLNSNVNYQKSPVSYNTGGNVYSSNIQPIQIVNTPSKIIDSPVVLGNQNILMNYQQIQPILTPTTPVRNLGVSYPNVITPEKPLPPANGLIPAIPNPHIFTHSLNITPVRPSLLKQKENRGVFDGRRNSRTPRRDWRGEGTPSRISGGTILNSLKPRTRKSFSRIFKSKKKQRSFSRLPKAIPPPESDPYIPPKIYKKPQFMEVIRPRPFKERRYMPKVEETTDVDILNIPQFFNNYEAVGLGLDVEDTSANKLSLDDFGETLYATGVNATHVISVTNNGANLFLKDQRLDRESTTVKCVRDGHVVLQEPNTNKVYLVDENMKEIKAIDGMYEEGKVLEDLHDYRHSLDYGYFLWRSGQDNLSIMDSSTFECVEVINQFWTFDKISSMPVAAVSDLLAERIVATSQAGPDNYVIHYWEDTPEVNIAYAKHVSDVVSSMYKLTCMEVSYDERRVYLAGLAMINGRAGTPLVVACEFNQDLREIAAKMLNDLDYQTPYRMVRVTGTEVLVIGCVRHIAIVEYIDGKLIQIASIPNLHDNEISDIVVRGRYMYTTAFNEPLIKVTEFDAGAGGVRVIQPFGGASKYGNFVQQRFAYPGLDDLHKITTSSDGERVFCGGRGLHILDTANNQLNPIELDTNKEVVFFGVKATNSGPLLMQEPTSNNLVLLSETLDLIRVVEGKQQCIFRKSFL